MKHMANRKKLLLILENPDFPFDRKPGFLHQESAG
jgi:hypothetical protein